MGGDIIHQLRRGSGAPLWGAPMTCDRLAELPPPPSPKSHGKCPAVLAAGRQVVFQGAVGHSSGDHQEEGGLGIGWKGGVGLSSLQG